jgi:serine/threonine-protein kinase
MPGPESKANAVPTATLQSAKSLAELALERGYCTVEQLSKAREKQRAGGAKDLGETLIEMGFLTKEQAQACKRAMSGKTIIGNFEILEKVGQGGMGAVFRARQISMDRIVAIKILPPKLAENPSFQKRFINEARVSAKLSHLNIINGIDCGEANGYTYFAMEFVDGRTIKEVMKEKGKFSPPEAIKIIRQMVEALAYAKGQGLVHRDVKPDNIMLMTNGVAKLCDLGLAKNIESNDDAGLTQSGQAVGTPHYISPEQARGEPVDFNSDIYSLGATFYHMLTGKTPFHGPTSAAVMALHIANDTRSPCVSSRRSQSATGKSSQR